MGELKLGKIQSWLGDLTSSKADHSGICTGAYICRDVAMRL